MNNFNYISIIIFAYLAVLVCAMVFIFLYFRSMNITKQNSQLYKNILILNKKYSFKRISENIKVNQVFNSKAKLDNFNILSYLEKDIKSNFEVYEKKINAIIKQNNDYLKYCEEYKNMKLTDRNTFQQLNCKIKFAIFNMCEKKLLKNNYIKMSKQTLSISYHGSYTSPTGKNHYVDKDTVSFEKLCEYFNLFKKMKMLKEAEELEKINKKNKEIEELNQRRNEVKELKKEHNKLEKDILEAKENKRRIQELERLERKINERERKVSAKESEFEKVIKNQIYTTNNKKIETREQNVEFDNLSITQKLKVLKEMFDNGEITYEEYKTKRGEIL